MRFLAEKGYSQTEIAKVLGISTRTVKRDWDKVRSYVKGQANKELNEIVEKRNWEFAQRYEGVPPKEQLRFLKHDVREMSKMARMLQPRERPKFGEMSIILRLDNLSPEGYPYVEVFPNLTNLNLTREFDLKINALKNGQKRELCSLHFSLGGSS